MPRKGNERKGNEKKCKAWKCKVRHGKARHDMSIQGTARKENSMKGKDCYPRYLGITRRSCLEAHMVLDMEYREQERLEHGPGGPIFLLLSQLCPVSSTSFHHYRPGLASERTLAP
jgi:hypothetical protein